MTTIKVEPCLFTSLQTRSGRTGYQLVVKGKSFLTNPRDQELLLNLMSLLVDQLAGNAQEGFYIYAPLQDEHGVFIRPEVIKDWQGRPGTCCSAIIFQRKSIPPSLDPETFCQILTEQKLFLKHANALKLVENLKEGQDLPLSINARDLDFSSAAIGDAALSKLNSECHSLIAAVEKLNNTKDAIYFSSNYAEENYRQALFQLIPPSVRFRHTYCVNSNRNLSIPFRMTVWSGDVPSTNKANEISPDSTPLGEVGRNLAKGLKSGSTSQQVDAAWLQACAESGKKMSVENYWEFLMDRLVYLPLLNKTPHTQHKPKHFARALLLHSKSNDQDTAAFCQTHCHEWDANEAWFENLWTALRQSDKDFFLNQFLKGVFKSWSSRITTRTLSEWIRLADKLQGEASKLLRSSLVAAIKNNTYSLSSEDFDQLSSLQPPAESRKWAAAIIAQSPDALLSWPRFKKEGLKWIEVLDESERLPLWRSIVDKENNALIRWALTQPLIGGCLQPDDLPFIEQHVPDADFDFLKNWDQVDYAVLLEFYQASESPSRRQFFRSRLFPHLSNLEVPVLWEMLKEEIDLHYQSPNASLSTAPRQKVGMLISGLSASGKIGNTQLLEKLRDPAISNKLSHIGITATTIERLLRTQQATTHSKNSSRSRSKGRAKNASPPWFRSLPVIISASVGLVVIFGLILFFSLRPSEYHPAQSEWEQFIQQQRS